MAEPTPPPDDALTYAELEAERDRLAAELYESQTAHAEIQAQMADLIRRRNAAPDLTTPAAEPA